MEKVTEYIRPSRRRASRKSQRVRRLCMLLLCASPSLAAAQASGNDGHSATGSPPAWQKHLQEYRSQRHGRQVEFLQASTEVVSSQRPNQQLAPQELGGSPGGQIPAQLTAFSRAGVHLPQGTGTPVNSLVETAVPTQPSGRQVACLAAQNWTPAHALRARGRTVVRAYCDEDRASRVAAAAINKFMHMQAAHQEDIGAGTALRAYYTRIVLADQMVLLGDSLVFSSDQQGKQTALLDQGVGSNVDGTQFERKRIELLDKAAQLDSKDRRLQQLLEHMANRTFDTTGPGLEVLEVRRQMLDCNSLVEFAFCNRCDLQGWVYLRSQVTKETAPVIAKMLSTATGGFSLPLPPVNRLKDLLARNRYAELAADIRGELSCVIQAQREWIEKTVLEKCSNLELAYQRIEFAEQTCQSWNTRLEQLKRLDSLGQAVPESVAAAKAEMIGAQVELASRRLEAKLAEVELSEACGGITQRCCAGQPWLVTGSR